MRPKLCQEKRKVENTNKRQDRKMIQIVKEDLKKLRSKKKKFVPIFIATTVYPKKIQINYKYFPHNSHIHQ